MAKTLFVYIVVSWFIFTQLTLSLANVTSELHQTSYENETSDISTTLSSQEISEPVLITNATIEPSTVVTESSKRKKTRFPQGRPRRQGLDYGSFPARYGIPTLFEMCPPLATTCPICTDEGVQVPPGFCDLVVLKVLAISPPQIDDNGRVCGKFGMLKLYGNFNEKEFRRLLRFSVSETCECAVKASGLYFLITPLSTFLKDGLLFNQIVLTERAVLLSTDRYIEKEILDVLNQCPLVNYNPEVSGPYGPPPVPPPIQPHVSPPTQTSPSYIPTPTPYIPPQTQAPPPYGHTSYEPLSPDNSAPAQQPIQTQVRPVPTVPLPTLPIKQTLPPSHSGKGSFVYPSLTQCLVLDTCPVCARLDTAGDITGQYCTAGFANLAVIRVPDASTLQGADSAYSGPTCLNLRTNIVYDITRTRDPKIVVSALTALLPVKCLACFAGLSGPVIVLLMGPVPPVPPAAQLDASFRIYILPVPSTLVLPSCDPYSSYGSPYSLVPIAAQSYDATNDCPEISDRTCPLCHSYPDTSFATACAIGFAIVTELNLAGPYFTSQRLPSISVKTTTTYYSKSIEVSIANPPSIKCIKGFFKIIQNIGLAPLEFPGEIIPFVSLPNCECLSQGFKRLLIFSSAPLVISDEGSLFLSKDINIAFLQPDAALPTCVSPPSPPIDYVLPPRSFYIPPHEVPLSPYARPARVPLTYIPPPPPPPSYIPPPDPHPVYILPPDYLPPPLKESPPLPYSPYMPLLPTTLPTVPKLLPETQPLPYTTEPPFEETPPPIIGCIEFGNGSCVVVDANQDNEAQFSINVGEDLPYTPQFQALNSLIYEDSSVWSPSFEECLSSAQPSCPNNLEESPEEFEKIFCNAKTALLVAVGIDYSILGNETAVTKRLTFIQPELPYVGIDYGIPNNPVSITVTVTPNKTMERRFQLQNNADYCYKEKVLVLSDLSDILKPKVVVGGLDVYIPGFCDSEIFDKVPSYGLLLSLLQPSDVKNPVQLTEDFTFMPLPEGRLGLPDCGRLPKEKPSSLQMQSEKFWVPVSPEKSVVCELSEEDNCKELGTVEDEFFVLPCDIRSAALVLIHNTSAGSSFGPNLEILETAYESGEKTIVLNVEPNVDEDIDSYQKNQYADDSNRCKYATVRVLKDLSRSSLIGEDGLFTIVGNANCDNPIFKKTNEVILLLTDELILPNTVIPLDYRAEVFGIPPGRTEISFCNANPSTETDDEKSSDEIKQILDKSTDTFDHDPFPDKSITDTKEAPPNVETFEVQETSCKGHEDDSCPVCDDIDSISSEEYCDSGLSFFAEVIEHEIGDEKCTNGIIVSLYDLTVRNGVPVSEVHKITYTIPSHCECPALKRGELLVLLSDESTLIADDLSINLSKGKYLYSSPLNTTFPPCSFGDSLQARSKDISNITVLDSPYQELRKIMPDLSEYACPTIDHTCPICRSMNDEELLNLICSSEEVLLVSRSKNQKENTRKFSKIGKATFTKHRVNGSYTLEMSVGKYENMCYLPLSVGNCKESLERYYYDIKDESCSGFTYTGCGGNANNFLSESDCEKTCFVEDLCEEGILDIKKIVKSSDDASYLDSKFYYTLPEHCSCSEMLKGDKKGVGYLLSTNPEELSTNSIQLSRNYYFVPLSKSQRKKQFSCPTDNSAEDSSENNISDSEVADNTDLQTNASVESSKKKSGFVGRLFG
ncbi:uncharacterized protein LOC129962298 [Argiope bruennichi]|uniref:uncharacterized protein LOC129962298 n=1 Tax=Argiope bruennichi TaxID=94029 RepID=UPI0024944201|nr:uncharacterized protein LOC129962298 [Argiope bruennichi]